MRFLVLGAGALGGYYGGMLQRGGAEVAFLVRPGRAAQLRAQGLVIELPEGRIAQPVKTLSEGAIDGRYDVVVLACKSYDLAPAMDAVAPGLAEDGALLPVLNGVNHIETLARRFGRERVLGGVGLVNGELSPEGVIASRLISPNQLTFGELGGERSARVVALERAFAHGGVPNTVSADIMAEMWAKFGLYGAIAVIATLTRARASEVAASRSGADLVAAAIAECGRVTAAEGYPPPAASEELVREVYSRQGSDYRPSVLIDIALGKRTEFDHTLGDLVRRADRRQIAVPLLRAALTALEVHEAGLR